MHPYMMCIYIYIYSYINNHVHGHIVAFTLSLWGLHFNCVLLERSKCSQRTTNPISPSFSIPDGFGTRSRTWSPTWKLCQAVLTKCTKLKVNGSERSQTERAIGKFRPQVFCQSELFRLSSLRVSGQSQSIIFHWCCRGGNIINKRTQPIIWILDTESILLKCDPHVL